MVSYRFKARDGTVVTFREPRSSDARQLMEFINRFVDEPMSGIVVNRKTTLREERSWLADRLREIRNKETVMLVVESGGRIMGNCDVGRYRHKKSHRALFGIALNMEIRGKGVGEALMRKVIGLARQRFKGLEFIDLSAMNYNARALNLYRKIGFVELARIPKAMKEGDTYVDEALMTLPLKPKKR
jgi:RimJ/RimL family protein N-acetyltransferase